MKFETPEQFLRAAIEPAKSIENKHDIPFEFILAQSALESGWGKSAIGNNIFGIKANKSWTGRKVLVTTTEYHSTNNVHYPEIISIIPMNGKFKYTVKDYFRDYDSIEDCLLDHAKFLIENKRYSKAFEYKDAENFALEVAKAGYATAPDYSTQLISMIHSVRKRLPNL